MALGRSLKRRDGGLRPILRDLSSPGVGFSIRSLFSDGALGGAYDFAECYQDSARTTPANVGDPVGSITDVSGNALNILQGTAGSRPVLREDAGGNRYLEGDGTDDFMSVALALSAYPLTIGLAAQANTSVASTALVSVGGSDTNYHTILFSSATNVVAQSRNISSFGTGGASIASKAVVISQHDGSFVSAWRNGVAITPVANANAYGSTSTLYVLRLRPAGGYAKAFLYPFFVIQKALTPSERAAAQRWLATHSGVTL